jgi:hypothetical protein
MKRGIRENPCFDDMFVAAVLLGEQRKRRVGFERREVEGR